jgi:ribonuclease T2
LSDSLNKKDDESDDYYRSNDSIAKHSGSPSLFLARAWPLDENPTTIRVMLRIAILLFVAGSLFAARSHKRAAASFDYYVLSLSWAPDFCAQAGSNKTSSECAAGRHIGFVVHGLWPQANTGRGPENCGPSSPVPQATVNLMLNYFPSAGLIQHEWSTHGTCSGLSAADYFATVRKARDGVQIPPQLTSLTKPTQASPAQIETEFSAANRTFPPAALRATCKAGELQEVRICFNKNLAPQLCTTSAGECTDASMTILPPR